MNIGSFLKAIGDLQPAASRALELRPGQTVRATVLEAHGKDGALLQIGDSQLLAKLETPLETGQTAVLQVKGETDEGVIVLQLAARGAKPAAEAEAPKWKELAGQLGFGAGDKGAAELVKAIRAAGLPLSAETAEGLRTAAALKPAGVDAGEWLRAAASAMQRGMPLTSETLLGLRQALSGPPVHELLARLEQELAAMGSARPSDAAEGDGSLAKRAAGVGEAAAPAAPAAAVGQDAKQRPAGPTASLGAGAGEAAPLDGAAEAAKAGPAPLKAADAAARLLSLLQGGPWLEPAADAAAESLPGRGVPADGGGASGKGVLAGADGRHAAGAAKGGAALSAAAAQAAAAAVPAPQGGEPPAARAAAEAAAAASAAGAEGEGAKLPPQGAVKAWLQWLGAGHEHQLARAASTVPSAAVVAAPQQEAGPHDAAAGGARPGGMSSAEPGAAAGSGEAGRTAAAGRGDASAAMNAPAAAARSGPEAAAAAQAAPPRSEEMDGAASRGLRPEAPASATIRSGLPLPAFAAPDQADAAALKPALLQLLAATDVPPSARDAATQLLQQITGQQLLLTPERSGAFFSQLTLQLPVRTPDGTTTASVHVQTRRGARGEVDASNCRLLFDLELDKLGTTLIDAAIVDKVVSLTVFADHPAVPALLEAGRQSLADQVRQAGYRLLGLRAADSRPSSEGGGADSGAAAAKPEFGQERYRGVDIKV